MEVMLRCLLLNTVSKKKKKVKFYYTEETCDRDFSREALVNFWYLKVGRGFSLLKLPNETSDADCLYLLFYIGIGLVVD